MIEFLIKLWGILKDADERFGFKKILMYTTYIIAVAAIINWKSILLFTSDYMKQVESERHDKNMKIRDKVSEETHSYLVELRAIAGVDRVLLFGFHNSISSLIGMPFKYIVLTDHAEPYGSTVTASCQDINSEVIGDFLRELKVDMFRMVYDIDSIRKLNPFVPKILNSPDAVAASYQYMSVLGKPVGILVLEWCDIDNIPSTEFGMSRTRALSGQATQDLNSIILRYQEQN